MNTRQIGKLARWFLSTSLLLAVVTILVGSAAPAALAASFEVTNLNDSGAGSLRQAILAANESLGADTITFSTSGTIALGSTLPPISDRAGLTIDGGSAITISGNNQVRVIIVNNEAALTVQNLTITGGNASFDSSNPDSAYKGSGIYNQGTLAVSNSVLAGNHALMAGGAIYNESGTLTVTATTFSANSATTGGGGIYNSAGTLTITGSNFSSNSSPIEFPGGGGAIYNNAGMLAVTGSTFTANSAYKGGSIINLGTTMVSNCTFSANSAFLGGGIYSNGPLTVNNSAFTSNFTLVESLSSARSPGSGAGIYNELAMLTVMGSTFSANNSLSSGGGIFNYQGTLAITNSTFSANGATISNSSGGGIYNDAGSVTVTHSTFNSNSATSPGSGGSFFNYQGTIILANTIIAHTPSGVSCSGSTNNPMTDAGYNIDDGTSCNFSPASHSLTSTDPVLDPDGLKDNGGSTQTISLQPGSPAIDAIPNSTNGCGTTMLTDQRGVTRPQGFACDIGAFESPPLNQPPVVHAGGPYDVGEGSSVVVVASGSDPEGGSLSYVWDLDNDGTFETPGQGAIFSAVGLDGPGDAAITITVQVTDNGNLTSTSLAMVSILNVAPTASFTNNSGVLVAGQSASLAFSNPFDPGVADIAAGFWYYYDCTGDGGFEANDPGETTYTCAYPDSGDFKATGRIQDKDGGFTDYTVEVTVLTPQQAAEDLIDQVQDLVGEGALNPGQGNALIAKLVAAIQQLDRENPRTGINQLQASINQVEAMIGSGVLLAKEGQPLIDAANEIILILSDQP